ncbi:MAG: hypothetical protein LUG58_02635 [Clostridiales bacterium]|nr:hypothetical protein [Clostridiales bacterium]
MSFFLAFFEAAFHGKKALSRKTGLSALSLSKNDRLSIKITDFGRKCGPGSARASAHVWGLSCVLLPVHARLKARISFYFVAYATKLLRRAFITFSATSFLESGFFDNLKRSAHKPG